MADDDVIQRMSEIVMPYASQKRAEALRNKTRLVYYTSADTAVKILENKEFWLRDCRCMNDFTEVQHGLRQLEMFLNESSRRAAFFTAVDSCHAGVADELDKKFNNWKPLFLNNTYLMCLSAHKDSEDRYGRLSMWRGYGREVGGAAIVMNVPMDRSNGDFNVFLSPVAYRDNLDDDMAQVIRNITDNREFISAMPKQDFLNWLFSTFAMAACCLKHPGFCEEEEWRLVHLPETWKSSYVTKSHVTIDEVPQYVYKLKLDDAVKAGHADADPAKLIHKVIVGPTTYPGPISERLWFALKDLGFAVPFDHLNISNIPLRM